jgi:ABC-type multidrug transport system ATPase subunit
MLFSAHLRLPPQRTLAEKEAVVAAILADLGMQDCADVRVQAISGGQRRRVSVGLELIVNPSVLILDVRLALRVWIDCLSSEQAN